MSAPSPSSTRPHHLHYNIPRAPKHQPTWPLLNTVTSLPLSINPASAGPALSIAAPTSANPFSPTPYTHNARNVSEIVPRLYISDLAFAENPSLLSSYRITHVLSTLPDTIFCPPPTLLPAQPTRLQVRVDDLPFAELAAHLPTTTAFIREALSSSDSTRVLVHCGEGISRSVSVVAAYLMAAYGWTPMEAIQYVKSKRRVAEPNFGFVRQLHEYARESLGRSCQDPMLPSTA